MWPLYGYVCFWIKSWNQISSTEASPCPKHYRAWLIWVPWSLFLNTPLISCWNSGCVLCSTTHCVQNIRVSKHGTGARVWACVCARGSLFWLCFIFLLYDGLCAPIWRNNTSNSTLLSSSLLLEFDSSWPRYRQFSHDNHVAILCCSTMQVPARPTWHSFSVQSD